MKFKNVARAAFFVCKKPIRIPAADTLCSILVSHICSFNALWHKAVEQNGVFSATVLAATQ
jgi:hypothetical protein